MLALAAIPVLAGCRTGPRSAHSTRPTETSDPPAALPGGWRSFLNARGGFSFGVPPRWSASGRTSTTLLRSPRRGLVLALAADRSDAGRKQDLASYVTATLRALPGYSGLIAGTPRPVGGLRYPAEAINARARFSRTGVQQVIRIVALRRPDLVTFVVIAFRNAELPGARHSRERAELLRSFRAQTPKFPPARR